MIGSNSEIHKWNAFVSDGSQKVRELAEDKASVISEIRLMTNLFPFKREFFYLRFAL